MAWRLSDLQEHILKMAWRNRKRNARAGKIRAADLSNREALAKFYGFPPMKPLDETRQGALVFNRKAIGIKRYNAASVAVAKSFNRLMERGLVERRYNEGVSLTQRGLQIAERLNSG